MSSDDLKPEVEDLKVLETRVGREDFPDCFVAVAVALESPREALFDKLRETIEVEDFWSMVDLIEGELGNVTEELIPVGKRREEVMWRLDGLETEATIFELEGV